MSQTKLLSVKTITKISVLSALAVLLMLIDFPLFFAPPFYKIDFSEVVVLIGGFSLGPAVAIIIEAIKIILNLLMSGTQTAGVGEFANFLIGISFVVPAVLYYQRKKCMKNAVIGMAIGTIVMTVVGSLLNYFVLLPVYSYAFGMPIQQLVEMGTAVNANITDLWTFVALAVGPFNLLKGVSVSTIVFLSYKRISPLLRK